MADESHIHNAINTFILNEMCYDRVAIKLELDVLCPQLTDDQCIIYEKIMFVVDGRNDGFLFIYVYGGTEKTCIVYMENVMLRFEG